MLDELSIVTRRLIFPNKIRDNFFLGNSPLLAYMRAKGMIRAFKGGTTIQQQFLFDAVQTDAYRAGSEFTPIRRQIIASNNFYPKFYVALLMDLLENLEVVQGDSSLNVANTLDVQVGAAISSLSARLGVMGYLHGQNVTAAGNFTATVEDRSLHINGMPEALNDGVTPGYDANVWTPYGGQSRSEVGRALNSIPRWMGEAGGGTRRLTYEELEAMYTGGYNGPTVGSQSPDLIITTKGVTAGIRAVLEGKQLVQAERDPYWGVIGGTRFQQALIVADEYAPGLRGADVGYGNFSTLNKSVVLPGAGAAYNAISPEFATVIPAAGTTLTVGDTMWALNSDSWLFDISASPLFSMGFSGWMTHPLTTRVIGRIHFAGNLRCLEPRLNRQGYGLQPVI